MSYIAFADLGTSADMGSQIQQYASMYAVSKRTNKTIVIPESSMYRGWGIKFPNLLNIEDVYIVEDKAIKDFELINQQDGLLVDEKVFNLKQDTNYCFTGLFHLYHYWYNDFKQDIFNLAFNKEFEEEAKNIYSTINQKELVSIHVRRGDYLNHDGFCKLDYDNYYKKAIELFNNEKYRFVVFSNDIEWCKKNIQLKEDTIFLKPNSGYVDLILMSMCQHNIIANSSFSWWAAFFNKNLENKKVVCPTNYVKSNSQYSFINSNYYPKDWINIDNI